MNEIVSVEVRKVNAGLCIFDIHGEVNAAAEDVFMNAITAATSSGMKSILLNFSGLKYMNSAGIGLLVTLIMHCNRNQQVLIANGLNEHYQQIFQYTHLNESITLYNNETEALTALAH